MEHQPKPSWLDGLPSRTAFGLGAAIGVGAVGLIGFLILLPGAIKGSGPSGATPTLNTAAAPTPTPSPSPSPTPPPPPPGPVNITVSDSDHIRGAKDAKVTIVEWSDFQCPFCSRFHPSMVRVAQEYSGKVRWIYRHFPLDSIHPNARPAAEASECAAEQGKFWDFADKLFERQPQLGPDLYKSLAKELGLNESKFNECVASGKYRQRVSDHEQAGLTAGVRGTPGSFVNGIEVPGAVPYEQLKGFIDQALKSN
ncbi:DsbA family protein [Candidatus Uhrbacteria bacterium]|nr:DsbA family protein [Candidatus Uhrbacteria bacterium]